MKKFVLCFCIILAFSACSSPRDRALAAIEEGDKIYAAVASEAEALQDKWDREAQEILENDKKLQEEMKTQQTDGGKEDE